MFFNCVILVFFVVPLVLRWLRWLAIFQQKEYRVDRVRAYLFTQQGIDDLTKLFPRVCELLRQTLKRPKRTIRILLLSFFSWVMVLVPMIFFLSYSSLIFSFVLFCVLVCIPVFIFLANLPLMLMMFFLVKVLLFFAHLKVKKVQPLIIGITGSYGKTSTKHLASFLISSKKQVFSTQKSFNTPLSLALDILKRYKGESVMVLEFAAYKSGEISHLAKIFQPQLVAITGLTSQHLAIFGSLENIIKAKAELIQALSDRGLVFYNQVDSGAKKIVDYAVSQTDKTLVIQPFAGKENSLKYTDIVLDDKGKLSFKLNQHAIVTKLVGRQYLSVIQGAASLAQAVGVSEKQIVEALAKFQPDETFIRFYRHRQGFWVVDDGRTSNPTGFRATIELSNEIIKKRRISGEKILVTAGIIDLGLDSDEVHQRLASRSKQLFTKVIYLGEPGKKQFRQSFYQDCVTQTDQVLKLLERLSVNDLVVVEGKLPIAIAKYLEVKQ